MGAERSNKKASFSWFCFQAYKHTLRHTSSTFNMMWDASGTCRRGQESDQSPEPEMIWTDPSTAGGKEEGEKKNPSFFQHNEIPAMHSQRALLSRTILKLVMCRNIEKKVVKVVNALSQWRIKSDPWKKWITTFFRIMNYFHQSRHVPGLVQWYVKFNRQFHEMTNLK